MDKFEYKIKADEIKELIAQGEYEQAAEIADSIDWRRVKSVMMLCTVSDLYKMCRRYEDSRDMLLLAYERHPGGRTIVYSLCELSIKMEEYVQAIEYYKEYVEIAPKDSGRYILQYKLYEAQDVSLEERIAVLEELKRKDYREKWAYELAYLYHRVGLATKCVEECDELFLWFGEGKYVIKALELKKLHAPLTPEQQYKYDSRFDNAEDIQNAYPQKQQTEQAAVQEETKIKPEQEAILNAATTRIPVEEIDIQVKTLEVGKYDTINLQEELAAGIQEYFGTTADMEAAAAAIVNSELSDTQDLSVVEEVVSGEVSEAAPVSAAELSEEAPEETAGEKLQDGEMRELYPGKLEEKENVQSEVFFGETGEVKLDEAEISQLQEMTVGQVVDEARMLEAQPPKEMADVLSMQPDGQISFVLPEREPVEKQITGQISIDDIILEWERLKKENEEKRQAEVRERVLLQTGAMFTEFDASVRDGLLEQLEKEVQMEEAEAEEVLEETQTEEIEVEEVPEETQAEETQSEEISEEIRTEEPEIEEVPREVLPEEAEAEEVLEETQTEEIEVEEVPEEVLPEEAEVEEVPEEVQPEETVAEDELQKVTTEEAGDESQETEDFGEVEELTEIVEAEDTENRETYVEERLLDNIEELPEEEEPKEETDAQKEMSGEEAPLPEKKPETVKEKQKIRNLTREERELYGPFIQGRSSKEQIIRAVDGISMASYTGNVIVTGEEGMDSMGLAKNMIREVQMTDSNFSGKIAKISGETLNTRDIKAIADDLNNGALIIQKASQMKEETAEDLFKVLQQEHRGIVVVLEDTKRLMDRFLEKNQKLQGCFTSRVDIAALSNDALVAFARKYAREKEYSIDQMGLLALHTRIADMQTSDHAVTVMDVKEIMDEAIRRADRKTIGHFFDVLFSRRYDEEDMIILKEKDFN